MPFSSFAGPDFSFTSPPREQVPLGPLLATWYDRSVALGRVPCVYLRASWCSPNVKLEESLTDPQMQSALSRVEVATFDIDDWGDDLVAAGFKISTVPAFFLLGPGGQPSGPPVTGGAWGANTPANMAPPLATFFDPARASLPSVRPPSDLAGSVSPAPAQASKRRDILMLFGVLLLLLAAVAVKECVVAERRREAVSGLLPPGAPPSSRPSVPRSPSKPASR